MLPKLFLIRPRAFEKQICTVVWPSATAAALHRKAVSGYGLRARQLVQRQFSQTHLAISRKYLFSVRNIPRGATITGRASEAGGPEHPGTIHFSLGEKSPHHSGVRYRVPRSCARESSEGRELFQGTAEEAFASSISNHTITGSFRSASESKSLIDYG